MVDVLSRTDLVDRLRTLRGATFATVTLRTEPDMVRDGNPYYRRTIKVSRRNVTLNYIYGNAVNRQRVREGSDPDFVPQPRRWGRRIEGTTLVEHRGEYYLEIKVERVLSYHYEVDGLPVENATIEPFLKDKGEGDRQELIKPVIHRDPKIANVAEITIGKSHYVVVDRESALV